MTKLRIAAAASVLTLVVGLAGYKLSTGTNNNETTNTVTVNSADVVTSNGKADVKITTKEVLRIDAAPSQIILLNTQVDAFAVKLMKDKLERSREQGVTRMFIVIDSPGGSVVDGADLISYMRSSNLQIDTVCVAICASMAAQIHQAGRNRLMAEKSILMFHPASGGTQGTLEQMLNQLTMFKKYVDRLDAEVAARSKISYAEFKSLLANELWLEAADALNMGFADKIAYVNYSLGNEDGEEVYDVRKEIAKTVVKDIKDILKPLTTKQSAETVREFK